MLDAAGVVPRAREATAGMALVDAQLVAAMKRTVTADHVIFELRPYGPLCAADMAALETAAGRYGTFLGCTRRRSTCAEHADAGPTTARASWMREPSRHATTYREGGGLPQATESC